MVSDDHGATPLLPLGELVNTSSKLSWVEEIPITSQSTLVDGAGNPSMSYSSSKHQWWGADWNLLVQYTSEYDKDALHVYVQLDKPLEFSGRVFSRSVSFCLYLLNYRSLNDYATAEELQHTFRLEETTDSKDIGRKHYFQISFLREMLDPSRGFLHPCSAALHSRGGKGVTPSLKGCLRIGVRIMANKYLDSHKLPLGYNSKVATGMVGLANLGATCYLNALLQMLFHIPAFRRAVYKMPSNVRNNDSMNNEDASSTYSVTFALQMVFRNLQYEKSEVNPGDLTRAFGWSSSDSFLQQDVQEMMRVLLDKLEELMKNTPVDGVICHLFQGKLKSFIRCLHVNFESVREEDFYDIQLDVDGCRDIYESFRQYTRRELLEGANQYDAGEGLGKQDAEKGLAFSQLPPILTIHLKRFQFDMRKMGFSKIHDYFAFPLHLNMAEFLANRNSNGDSADSNSRYSLHSVLVHSGDVGGGHYYAYIRPTAAHFADSQSHNCDPSAVTSSQWFKFDDEHVSIASEHEAVEGNFGRRKASPFPADLLSEESSNEIGGGIDSVSSAYMLVYVRDKDLPEIMRPVVEEDIPPSMAAVVNSELLRRQMAIRAREHEKAMTSVRIYTESAVRAWCRPSAYQDFLVETDFVSLRALKADCGLLGLIFLIATAFEVLPHRVLLFTIGERVPLASKPVHGGSNISVSDEEIESTRLDYLHDVWNNRDLSIMKFITQDHRFYIHVRDPLESPSLENDIRQEYLRLMDRECELLQQMRLLSGNDLTCGDFDWFEGCGIGRGLELCRRMLPSGDASNELIKHLIVMNESALALARRAPRLHSCDRLIFFRAYDPHRELRLPLEVVDSAFPIKYLFSKIVNLRRGRYRVLYNTIRRFLEANNYYPLENQVRDKWVDADLWLSSTPVTWRQIVDDEGVDSDDNRGNKRGEADEEIDSDDEIEHGDFLYVDGTTLGEVYSCFEWARFEIKKRTFALRPYSPKDGQLLQALTDADDSIPTLDVLSGMRVDIVAAEAAKVLGVPNLASNIMLYSLEGSSNSLWLDPATQLRDAETAVERMSNILLFRLTPFPGSGGLIKGRRRLEFILADGATRQRYRAVLERESQAAIIDGKRRKTLSGQRDIENASLPFSEIYNEALLLKVCDEIDFGLVLEHVNERLEYKMFDDESKGCMLLLYSGSANCHIEHTRLCPPILDDIPLLSDIPYSWMDAPDSEAPTFLQMISSEAIRPLQADGCLLKRFYFIHQVGRKWQLAEDNYKFPPFYSYVSPHDTVATLFVRLRLHAEGLGSNVVKLAILRQKPLFLDESSAVKVLESVSESEDVRFGLLTGLEFIHEEPSGKPRMRKIPSSIKIL